MPFFEVLRLRVFLDMHLGDLFLDLPFPLKKDEPLVDIIEKEVCNKQPDRDALVDFLRDIKSVSTSSGMDAYQWRGNR